MKQFLIKYYKAIYRIVVLFLFLILFILLTTFNLHTRVVIIGAIGFYFLVPMALVKMGQIMQRMTDNAVFSVCPRCGYASGTCVDICRNCDYRQGSPIRPQEIPKVRPDGEYREIEQNIKHGIHKPIPQPIMKSLPQLEDEIVLVSVKMPSMRLFSITRNGDRLIFNKFNARCILNWFILTNKRLCFHAEMFGGWRIGFCHSYDEIKRVRTHNKALYSPLMDEVDRMTIETSDGYYQLRGLNPKKLYDAIRANLRKYGSLD